MCCGPAVYFEILRQIPDILHAAFLTTSYNSVAASNMGIHLLNLEFSKTERSIVSSEYIQCQITRCLQIIMSGL